MEAEIRPEPDDEQRAAILRAVEEELARDGLPVAYRSRWRQLGIHERSDESEESSYGEMGRPRSSPGASRA